jgi:hypothetical protein
LAVNASEVVVNSCNANKKAAFKFESGFFLLIQLFEMVIYSRSLVSLIEKVNCSAGWIVIDISNSSAF